MPEKVKTMQKKPNILFIMADDSGWFNLSAYNHGLMGYRRPNSDLVAGASASRLSNSQPRSVLLKPRPFKAWSRDNSPTTLAAIAAEDQVLPA